MNGEPDLPGASGPREAIPLHEVLSDEGFRLFFPLTALHAALWPFLWVAAWSFDLPFAGRLPPGLWHMHEMIVGSWGAALLGFLTTAAPEWTDTPRLRGRPLWMLAVLWGTARLVGLLGAEPLLAIAGLADLAWMLALAAYLVRLSWQRRTDRLLAFLGWLLALVLAAAAGRIAMIAGDFELARGSIVIAGFVFLALLGLALARITVPITNVVLDPTESTSPFRPHPGRLNLAPGLVAMAIAGDLAGLSPTVSGFLWIAAGAGFMDRVAEGFIGREAFRMEILALMGASGLSGLGLLAFGASCVGAPWGEAAPLHLALMGGLGMAVLAVLAIASRFHTGQGLGLSPMTKAAFAAMLAATVLRTLPEMGLLPWPPSPTHLLASLLWAAAFLLWLRDYWPALSDPALVRLERC